MNQTLYVLLDEPTDPSVNTQVLSHYYTTQDAAIKAAKDETQTVADDFENDYNNVSVEPVFSQFESSNGRLIREVIGYAVFAEDDQVLETITAQAVNPED